jgi:hypothetical protein
MILLALVALAQEAPTAPRPQPYQPSQATIVAGFDTDGDARITRAEASAGVTRSFGTGADLGYIAFADWAARWLGDRNAVPSALEVDRDGDNRITLIELQDRFAGIFARLDKDKDGVLTRAELLTVRTPPLDLRRRRRDDLPEPPRR